MPWVNQNRNHRAQQVFGEENCDIPTNNNNNNNIAKPAHTSASRFSFPFFSFDITSTRHASLLADCVCACVCIGECECFCGICADGKSSSSEMHHIYQSPANHFPIIIKTSPSSPSSSKSTYLQKHKHISGKIQHRDSLRLVFLFPFHFFFLTHVDGSKSSH